VGLDERNINIAIDSTAATHQSHLIDDVSGKSITDNTAVDGNSVALVADDRIILNI
jgi:hypothetical protein